MEKEIDEEVEAIKDLMKAVIRDVSEYIDSEQWGIVVSKCLYLVEQANYIAGLRKRKEWETKVEEKEKGEISKEEKIEGEGVEKSE